jgi:hypothetical protein
MLSAFALSCQAVARPCRVGEGWGGGGGGGGRPGPTPPTPERQAPQVLASDSIGNRIHSERNSAWSDYTMPVAS